jgi:hypothetical protein
MEDEECSIVDSGTAGLIAAITNSAVLCTLYFDFTFKYTWNKLQDYT